MKMGYIVVMKNTKCLTFYEMKFAENITKGMTLAYGYRNAGYKSDKMSAKNVGSKAGIIAKKPDVAEEINRLICQNENTNILTRENLLNGIREVIVFARSSMVEKVTDGRGNFVNRFNEKTANSLKSNRTSCPYNWCK
jgi:Terminase small subunit.